jgi:hypothetical protein
MKSSLASRAVSLGRVSLFRSGSACSVPGQLASPVPCQLACQERQVGELQVIADRCRPLPAWPAGTKG